MLILAEGTVHRPVEDDELAAIRAWLGPMVDAGCARRKFSPTNTRRSDG